MSRLAALVAALALAGCAGGAGAPAVPTPAPLGTPAPPLAPTTTATYADANGSLTYALYVPATARAPYPLVLALHGCLQSPAIFEAGARWFEDAQANGYAVAMPQQYINPATNPYGCWPYWSQHYRGRGEAEVLAGVVRDVESRAAIDPNRVYAAGLSTGAAMAVALAADYPDVFAAIAVGSGAEYQPCTSDAMYDCLEALTNPSLDQDPAASGRAAYAQAAGTTNRPVPAILFHGDADTVIAPFNLQQTLASLATMNDGIASAGTFPGTWTATASTHDAGQVPGGYAYDHYTADGGRLDWTIVHGMNHAWSGGVVDAASTAYDGNNYDDPKGPNETAAFRAFLLRYARNAP